MSVLTRKLLRAIWTTKGQFLAVTAVIMVGICVYISMSTLYYNLSRSQEVFYQESNFADYYFHVVRAPQQVTRQIEAVPGVVKATGRIQKDVPVLKDANKRATARLVSYPLPLEGEVNRPQLQKGRLFEKYPVSGGIEILTDPQYTEANGLGLNDYLTIVAEGKQVHLNLVGTAISPEFIMVMKDAATLMPDPRTFGVFMIPHNQAEQILNLSGQINQVLVILTPGVDEKKVVEEIKSVLAPYGNLADYPRKDQLSHFMLEEELKQLKAMVRFMPTIFLGVAAAIQLVMLGRMIKSQRMQIGVMKALGYNNRQIMQHYTGYALAVALLGAFLGSLSGIYLASVLSQIYAMFFNLPETISGVNVKAILYGFMICLTVSLVAGLSASKSVVSINPAESMRPEPPKGTGRIPLEQWKWFWQRLDPTWKMGLRTISRKMGRFAVTLVGVIFAVGLLVMSLFSNDSINYLIDKHYYQDQNYDLLIRFNTPIREAELLNISRLEGVIKTESMLEIPVNIHFNGRSEDDTLFGMPLDLTMKALTGENEKPLQLPDEGLIMDVRTARKLGAKTGDTVEVETLLGIGPSRRANFTVMGISEQLMGSGSYLSLDQANRLLQERQLVSAAMLKVDPGQLEQLEAALSEMTGIGSISSLRKELDNLNQYMDSMLYTIIVMVGFAVVLGFAIVYNSSVISFAERKRELASLRVLGFTTGEVSGLLLKETLLQSLLGVALGLPFGLLITRAYIQSLSNELFTLPVIISPMTYVLSALGGIFFIMMAHLFAVRGVKKLDLVDVLKNRD